MNRCGINLLMFLCNKANCQTKPIKEQKWLNYLFTGYQCTPTAMIYGNEQRHFQSCPSEWTSLRWWMSRDVFSCHTGLHRVTVWHLCHFLFMAMIGGRETKPYLHSSAFLINMNIYTNAFFQFQKLLFTQMLCTIFLSITIHQPYGRHISP